MRISPKDVTQIYSHSLLFALRIHVRYQSVSWAAPYHDSLPVGTSVLKCHTLSDASPDRSRADKTGGAYERQISFLRATSKRGRASLASLLPHSAEAEERKQEGEQGWEE